MELLNNFSQIVIETPVDQIIRQIKELITSGQLNPGDRLPPERKLCEKLGVGRTHLRDALKKLEFYGILKTHPQSGTCLLYTSDAADDMQCVDLCWCLIMIKKKSNSTYVHWMSHTK